MNVNQIVNLIIRMIMRRGINAGINKGMGMARGGNKSRNQPKASRAQMSPEEEAEFLEFKRQKKLARKQAEKQKRKNDPIDRM
ncbi:hypothetical protein [Neptunicoccus cionae]|uniref:Uncharacterized protein n=1 Tax=Neptunicoccus cionae TaxID=2035344 RepID=A0A916R379_9RHOB|nr:hypothetical protein [Amylibacter cionae]GGA24549.1 hypothetical protein GCM10011498_26950 [Amylibacter cionae]